MQNAPQKELQKRQSKLHKCDPSLRPLSHMRTVHFISSVTIFQRKKTDKVYTSLHSFFIGVSSVTHQFFYIHYECKNGPFVCLHPFFNYSVLLMEKNRASIHYKKTDVDGCRWSSVYICFSYVWMKNRQTVRMCERGLRPYMVWISKSFQFWISKTMLASSDHKMSDFQKKISLEFDLCMACIGDWLKQQYNCSVWWQVCVSQI